MLPMEGLIHVTTYKHEKEQPMKGIGWKSGEGDEAREGT